MSARNKAERFDYRELYSLWLRFKDDVEALEMLSDFADIPISDAKELDRYFWEKYEAACLNTSNRGVENRTRKHI